MPTIYVNGTAITENDEVYVNGSPLAVGKSVYLNGSIVWTRQSDCTAISAGTSYQQWSTSGSVSNTYSQGMQTVGTAATVNAIACSGSTVSVRAGADSEWNGMDGYDGSVAKIYQNSTEVASAQNSTGTGGTVWSSWVTRTIATNDVFTLRGYILSLNASVTVRGQMYTATATSTVNVA